MNQIFGAAVKSPFLLSTCETRKPITLFTLNVFKEAQMRLWTADTPGEVKTAIALAWMVLLVDASLNLWQIVLDAEVRGALWLLLFLTVLALASYALTGLFIFYSSRRRNWARIAFLIWTVASWSLWYFFPQEISAFPWGEWLASGSLVVMEVCVLILLFRGRANRWYS